MLRTLGLMVLLCGGFWFGIDFIAEQAPTEAGRVALTFIVGCTVLFRARRAKDIQHEFEVLNHKLDRINATVVDIQQNPLVEFNTGTRRRDGESLH